MGVDEPLDGRERHRDCVLILTAAGDLLNEAELTLAPGAPPARSSDNASTAWRGAYI